MKRNTGPPVFKAKMFQIGFKLLFIVFFFTVMYKVTGLLQYDSNDFETTCQSGTFYGKYAVEN